MAFLKKIWAKENFRVSVGFVGIYILCIGIFFFYNKTRVDKQAENDNLISAGIITVWYVWIFIHNRILLRHFLLKRKVVAYIAWLSLGIALTAALQVQLLNSTPKGNAKTFFDAVLIVSFYTLVGTIIFLAILYLKESKRFYQLSSLKKEVELQQLKNQLNPHFLFNSLNNIYSYSLENNTYGIDLLLKLSQLMRFILESTSRDTVFVGEEISFIDNYVLFEKERMSYRCDIVYVKEISYPERLIAPLVLFPFVENAFKHGTNSIDHSKIKISIKDSLHGLELSVSNAIKMNGSLSTKIGLSNIGRRLELLFPNSHQLIITNDNSMYSINLKLEWK